MVLRRDAPRQQEQCHEGQMQEGGQRDREGQQLLPARGGGPEQQDNTKGHGNCQPTPARSVDRNGRGRVGREWPGQRSKRRRGVATVDTSVAPECTAC
eukprot:12610650-Alexandrium_andersonii.AAC.1